MMCVHFLFIFLILVSRANVFHFQRLIWHIYMTDYLVVTKVAKCIKCNSFRLTFLCYTIPYGFSKKKKKKKKVSL